jgi:imidazole glycerol-phosphate synthase subunit HisF
MTYKQQISIFDIAKKLRQSMTPAERILWEKVKNNSLGIKIRRQEAFIFGAYRYVADFYCPALKLIIEIDGDIHEDKEIKEIDEFREDIFKEMGYKVIRFNNEAVINDLDKVIKKIKEEITALT